MAFSGSASSGLVTWWAGTPPSSYSRSSSPITAPLSARSRIRRMFTARAERFGSAWSLQVCPLAPNKLLFQWWDIITITRDWNVAVFPCHLLISSLVLWSSPAGVGYRRGHHRRGVVPHHRCVLQAVQEEESKAARKMRGGPPQREKRPYSVVRVRGEGRGEEALEKNGTLPLSLPF